MAKKNAEKNVETTETVKATTETTGEVKATEAPAAPAEKKLADIVRGRMPLPIVFLVKFSDAALTDAALALKFRTTSGKVNDIRKGRNFGYITADYKPSQEMKDRAIEYCKQLKDESVLPMVEKLEVATPEQQAAFDLVRKDSRPGRKAKTAPAAPAAGEPVPAGDLAGLTE